MTRILLALLAASAALLPQAAKADRYGYHDGAREVRCESRNEREQFCRVDTRGGVRIVDQRSDAPCIYGRTWGYDRRGIWVDGGCRARFVVGGGHGGRPGYGPAPGYGPGPGYGHGGRASVVRCESRSDRPTYCAIGPRVRDVRIERQLSRSRCDYGRTWGYDRRGIWVERGCRADFVVY